MQDDPPPPLPPPADDRGTTAPPRANPVQADRAAREQREAAALRENLLRRKAHKRTRPDPAG